MKKALTILMGLAVVLGSFGFSSCNQKEEGKKTESPLQVGQVQDMEGYRKIYDFESQDEINSIKAFWDFGKMQVSDEHATSGKHSMRLEVLGTQPDYQFVFHDWETIDEQYLQFYIRNNEWIGLENGNLSEFDSIMLDVYNDSGREIPLTMHLVAEADKNGKGEYRQVNIDMGTKMLAEGENKAEFKLGLSARLNGIENLRYIRLILPNHVKGEAPAVLYVDNFRAKQSAALKTVNKNFSENELLLFEDDEDADMFTNTLSNCQYRSFLSFEAYSAASTQGNRSMLVTQPVSPRSFFCEGEVTAHMSSATLAKLDLSKYDERYVIKADFMLLEGADSKPVRFFVQFDDMTYTASATMNKGRKTTVTVPLSKFQTRERLYDLGFILNEILGGEEVKFVVDNIRFELK